MSKAHLVFDSVWYNVLMCIISIVVFVEKFLGVLSEGFMDGPTVMLIIWSVILFHFVSKLISSTKKISSKTQ